MVRLKAKGDDPLVDAMLPANLAEVERTIVMASLRDAVDSVVEMSSSTAKANTSICLNQTVVLRRMVEDILKEGDDMLLMLRAVEIRLMELN